MALSDLEWTQKITSAVSNAVPTLFGEGAVLASNEPERLDRRYSFMFRYHIRLPDHSSQSVLVKVPHESWVHVMDEAITSERMGIVIKAEFDAMTAIADMVEAANIPDLFAIRPGACFPELGALLEKEYSLRMLKTSLTKPAIVLGVGKSWTDFEKQVESAGVWLRIFQKHTDTRQTKTVASLEILEQLDLEFSALEKVSGQSWNKLREQFRHLYALIQNKEVQLSGSHNDYHLGNVFVLKDGRVGVLDPNWVDCASVYEDLSTLLIDPVTRKAQVFSLGLLFRSSMYSRYQQAVFRGYFENANIPRGIIYFYCALDVLYKWRADEEILGQESSAVRRLLSRLLVPIFRHYFQRLTTQYLKWGIVAMDSRQ